MFNRVDDIYGLIAMTFHGEDSRGNADDGIRVMILEYKSYSSVFSYVSIYTARIYGVVDLDVR